MRSRRTSEREADREADLTDEVRCRLVMGAACGNRNGGTPDDLVQEEEWLEELAQLEMEESSRRGVEDDRRRSGGLFPGRDGNNRSRGTNRTVTDRGKE